MGIIGRLNKKNFERTIEDMIVNEEAFIPPWALQFDYSETPYLNLKEIIHKTSNNKMDLKIVRTGKECFDYDLDISESKYKWIKSDVYFDVDDPNVKIVQMYYNNNLKKDIMEPENIPDDPNKYPLTYQKREELNNAIKTQDFEYAGQLRNEINQSQEPLYSRKREINQ